MRRTSSRSLAATSLLALLTALAVPKRAEAEERANHATSVRMVRDAERDVVRVVVGFSDTPAFTARHTPSLVVNDSIVASFRWLHECLES